MRDEKKLHGNRHNIEQYKSFATTYAQKLRNQDFSTSGTR